MPFYEDDKEENKTNVIHASFLRGKQNCLICGRNEDWKCRVREDGLLGLCSYTRNDDGRQDRYDRYIHNLANERADKPSYNLPKAESNSQDETELRDAVYLNDVYSRYLESLTLNAEHKENLLNRGLSEEVITENGYKSVPKYNDRHNQIADLASDYDLEGISGFFLDGEDWCINQTFSGFYIPCRDIDGSIIGLQIRRDDSEPKYMWFSSSGKDKGTSSGSPFHFVNPDNPDTIKQVFLTEGALKADIIAAQMGFSLIAMGGVNISPKKMSKAIFDSFDNIEDIIVAFDSDWQTNPNVKSALIGLLDELKDNTAKILVAVWSASFGKGLDDVFRNEDYHEDAVDYYSVECFLKNECGNGGDEPPSRSVVFESEDDSTSSSDVQTDNEDNHSFVYSWDDFSRLSFSNTERVIFGLVRGNVGLVVAPTNLGKTTCMLNLALSATAQREFLPILNRHHTAKRVLYVDGEATKAELQADIEMMMTDFNEIECKSVSENLFLVCDEEFNDEPLDLANPEHLRKIESAALGCNADLIVVDTLAALMEIEDENDNAKVKMEVMKPLKKLAKKANSAVLLLHHSGKYYEGAPQGVNRGRGASTIPALSRAVFNLERDNSGKNRVLLSCSKVKGEHFRKTLLQLNPQSRWFSVIDNMEVDDSNSYGIIVDSICEKGSVVKREDILAEFDKTNGLSRPTIDRILNKAVDNKDIEKVRFGNYKCSNTQHNHQELALDE